MSLFRKTTLLGGAAVVITFASALAVGRADPPREKTACAHDVVDIASLRACTDPAALHDEISRLRSAAEAGDTRAQLLLGKALREGVSGLPKDVTAAHDWFRRAADGGSASAAYHLGVMAKAGEGETADPQAAQRWLAIAAERGSAHAAFLLGNAYRAGAGVPQSNSKALELYEIAANRELPAALQTLAMAHLNGELDLPPDDGEYRRYAMEAEHAIGHPPTEP